MLPEPLNHKEAGTLGGRGKKAIDNVNSFSGAGNLRSYTVARLKRDRPDLAERVIAGELSANAAAVEAGFRKGLCGIRSVATPPRRPCG
jgi:hypothetical protein